MSDQIAEILQRINDLERAQSETVVRGKISEIDPAKQLVRVAYGSAEKPMLTAWLPVKPLRSGKAIVWWFPEVGEGVTVISPGNLLLGEVYPGSYHGEFPAPSSNPELFLVEFGDGSSVSHNRESHELKVVNVGNIDFSTPEQIKMSATKGFILTGDIDHQGDNVTTGNITATKDITDKTRSMADDRGIYNDHLHPHGTPNTAKPIQQQ